MATSSIANLFSFTPSKPPPSPPLSTPRNPPSHLSGTTSSRKDGWAPLVLSNENDSNSLLSSSCSSDVISAVCPSLAYANTLFFRSAYNVQVFVDDNEPEEKILNRFRRELMKAGVIQECKRRRFFENTQDQKKRKSREAAKRNRQRRFQPRSNTQNRSEISKNKKKDGEEDNWELPEGDIPY
ncbi:30S ribosomal S21, chloroplastic-like [Olea europaea subsp. europaea]|uniref:30S ribosomal S21, chloroplastic-like n=1 Tax=Olea europaea subsp. europaea TaxID=158383 RepID=A0A8S0VFM5_OLEEU|nr:30S ribosomal S21, chloroplastic-like [Olea europaea subsp. europaea]